ncbi:MAG: hypothetical protein CMN31_05225 [Sandaracinus sp.]|nr:hypothetical protein [Sandaracinus sp.]MBJ70728.1 hypothetical protein [Sandaracinus sp.]
MAIGAAVVAAAGVAFWASLGGEGPAEEPVAPGAQVEGARAEEAIAYRFAMLDEGRVRMGERETRGKLALEGTLALQPVPSHPAWSQLGLVRLERARWSMNEEPMPDPESRFRGAQLWVRWDEAGGVEAVEAAPELEAPVARALEILALALGRERLGPGAAREAERRTPFGLVRTTLRAEEGCAAAPCAFAERWDGADYLALERGERAEGRGRREAGFDEEGRLARVEAEEREALASGGPEAGAERHLRVELERVPLPEGLPRPRLRGRRVAVREMRGDAARRALEQRAAGLSVERMLADLRAIGGSRLPDHDRWLWRATGLLQLDPEAAAALADACLDGSLEGRPRQVALELLANVGDPAAERALRRVLADPSVVAAEDYPAMLQRTLLIREPEDATIAFLADRAEALEGASARSAYVAAGGLVGHAREREPERGGEAVRRMVDAFDGAEDPLDRRALVTALGNAAASEARDRLVEAARDDDRALRLTAARALAHLSDEESAGQLADMVGDGDPLVQRAAVAALSENRPTAEQLGRIARSAATLPEGTRVALVTLAERLARQPGTERTSLLALIDAIRPTRLPDDAAHRLMALRRDLVGAGPR